MNKINEISLEKINQAINQSTSLAEVLQKLECHDNSSNRTKLN